MCMDLWHQQSVNMIHWEHLESKHLSCYIANVLVWTWALSAQLWVYSRIPPKQMGSSFHEIIMDFSIMLRYNCNQRFKKYINFKYLTVENYRCQWTIPEAWGDLFILQLVVFDLSVFGPVKFSMNHDVLVCNKFKKKKKDSCQMCN